MGRVRETLHDVLRQTDAVLLALCVASTLYGMVLIASATSFRGTLKYVAVQGLGLLKAQGLSAPGYVLGFNSSGIDRHIWVFGLERGESAHVVVVVVGDYNARQRLGREP